MDVKRKVEEIVQEREDLVVEDKVQEVVQEYVIEKLEPEIPVVKSAKKVQIQEEPLVEEEVKDEFTDKPQLNRDNNEPPIVTLPLKAKAIVELIEPKEL